ncbi:protein containing Alpha-2-macroglobulin, partial [mine drainage metagenome]
NGYINVQFVRDPSSNAIYMSPLSYGVAPFSVDLGARREPLILDAPTLIKPGQTLHMTVHTPGSAQVVVFAVDEGILQVAGYKLGDPLDFFFHKRMLQVSTAQILDLILPAFDKLMGMSTPGGDENALRSQQLNPFRRKHEKPVAYWSGITTVNGSHTFDYIVPDSFNGALRVMAMAVTPQRIGIAQRQTTVRGDFVLSPNAPLAVAPGDTFTVSMGVANNLTGVGTAPLPISVSLAPTPALAALSPLTQTLRLAPGHAGTLQFQLRANAVLGSADLRFTARYGDKQAQRGTTLSVRPPLPLQSDVSFGRLAA